MEVADLMAPGPGEAKSPYAIEIEDLWRIYNPGSRGEVQALRGVNLKAPAGRLLALRGRSGSGKTTLINCIGGLDKPTRGEVRVFGDEPASMSEKELARFRREKVGFVFQSFGLSSNYSAYENVELKLRIVGLPFRERRSRTLHFLQLVGLDRWKDHRPEELSGGQQQRVAIARALVNQPRLILADEPTGDLDSSTGREIMNIFRKVVDEEHVTLLIATHDPMVETYADQSYHLQDGTLLLNES
jgi:putative ABC transport system ATP-binding protein